MVSLILVWSLSTSCSQQVPQGIFTLPKGHSARPVVGSHFCKLTPPPTAIQVALSFTGSLLQTSEGFPHSQPQAWLYEWHPHSQTFLHPRCSTSLMLGPFHGVLSVVTSNHKIFVGYLITAILLLLGIMMQISDMQDDLRRSLSTPKWFSTHRLRNTDLNPSVKFPGLITSMAARVNLISHSRLDSLSQSLGLCAYWVCFPRIFLFLKICLPCFQLSLLFKGYTKI